MGTGKGATYEECPRRIKDILQFLERPPFNQRPSPSRLNPRLRQKVRHQHPTQHNKRHGANRPREANPRQKLPRHGRKNQPPGDTPTRRDTKHQRALLLKVCRYDGQHGAEDAAVAEPHAQALREKEVPVLGAEGRGEGARDEEDGAREEDGAEVARVGEAAGEGADEEEEECAERAEPGNVAWGAVEEVHVVGLECAKRVYEAPERSGGVSRGEWVKGLTRCS